MVNISLNYGRILQLSIYMESDIKSIAERYRDISWKYQETCKYNEDMEKSKRSFNTDYGITKEYYESYTKDLQIRQYEKFIELKRLVNDCKEQNGGHGYIGYTRGLEKELIRFNPSYDSVSEMLERLKTA